MAMLLNTKLYDIAMIILIVVYTALVLVQFGIQEQAFYPQARNQIFIAELVILGIFILEILMHIYAYGCLYIKDFYNIMDIIITKICLAFVIIDV